MAKNLEGIAQSHKHLNKKLLKVTKTLNNLLKVAKISRLSLEVVKNLKELTQNHKNLSKRLLKVTKDPKHLTQNHKTLE